MNELMHVLYCIILYFLVLLCRPLRFKDCGGDPLISGPKEGAAEHIQVEVDHKPDVWLVCALCEQCRDGISGCWC